MSLLFVLLAFAIAIFFIARPVSFRLPPGLPFLGGREITLDYVFGSVLGVLIILIAGVLTPGQAFSSLVGRPGFSPFTIIVLFMAVAYIAISLDSTGFFEYLALRIVLRSGGDGRKLFFYFYFLSGFITLFTSNDIVILTLTPIIFYFGKHAKIRVLPYLVAEFFAANIWSMCLYVGNPTNIIAASASGIGIIEYSAWMLFPTIAAGLTCLALLYLVFSKSVSIRFVIPKDIDPKHFLKDRRCAYVTFGTFCLTLATLFVSPLLGLEMWVVALFFALALFTYDAAIAFDEYSKEHLTYFRVFKHYVHRQATKIYEFRLHFIADHIPWKIIPFLFCSFIMVEALVVAGVTDAAATLITALSFNVFAATISMGFLSAFTANLVNNQPMTVLFTKITESSQFALPASTKLASIFSLIIGSNLGANITLIGALAGIMWIKILRDKDQHINYRSFAKLGLIVTPLVLLVACVTLAIEFFLFG
ncbi:MAG: SLC13 family permease [Candidatus Aenigmarchaeota archaeon]|nr:SLC13 family permease [Candidatus Aenigmarchaeota archaeon]